MIEGATGGPSVCDLDSAASVLRGVVIRLESDLPREDVASVWELVDVGEVGVAFENLCTQLDEHEIAIGPDVRSDLAAVGTYLALDPDYWESLATC